MREVAIRADGACIGEQWVHLGAADLAEGALRVRCIRLKLPTATRDGDDTLCLLTTLSAEQASAATLAELYRQRWTIERAFLHLTTQLRCEVHTLCYPGAALLALACAMVSYNVLAVIKAAIDAAHGAGTTARLSGYYIASEMANLGESLDTIIDAADWQVFRQVGLAVMALWLRSPAALLILARYRKTSRSTRNAPVQRVHDPHQTHVSVARLLQQRKAKSP